jgi:cellulose synthase/poly-beta-1,6-N-acetylglucosamine synthase-like glycosyltransferase
MGVNKTPFDVPRDWDWRPVVTFMIPSYNEGRVVCDGIESIMASDWPKDKIEIIAVCDCSTDDTFEWLKVMRDKYPDNVIVWRNEPNKGKALTLIDIVHKARGEIVFTVDSDTIIANNTIRQIVSSYADPDMGGVCGFVLCKNLNDSVWTQMQGMMFAMFKIVTKTFENQFQTARVLSGQIASFRRSVFLECVPMLLNRSIMGIKHVRSGEDTYLTTLLCMGIGLSQRWKVFANFEARAWTNNPATMMGYLKQQLRWWRSNQTGATVLYDLYPNIKRAGLVPVLNSTSGLFGVMSLVTLFIFFVSSGYLCQLFANILLDMSLYGVIACVLYNHNIGRTDSVGGKIKNPVFAGVWFGIWVLVSWMSLAFISFFTFDDGGWVTRQSGQSNIGKTN